MLRRHNRLLVACYILADALSAAAAFLLAYLIRFESLFTELVRRRDAAGDQVSRLFILPVERMA